MPRCHFLCFRHSRRSIADAGLLSACALATWALIAGSPAAAQVHPSVPQPFIEELRQQERERALRTRQERAVDARLPVETSPAPGRLPDAEMPCFRIERLVLGGERAAEFQWLLTAAAGAQGDDGPSGRCLGTKGVDTVLARLQQALVERGWVTTRVLAPPQDLAGGTLAFTLVPGRIAAIRFAEGTGDRTALRNAIPARPGDLLNLRDAEQGLENLKRLPTADADLQIEPSRAAGARPGDSDLVVKYGRRFPLRGTLSLDDSGTRATGRTQAGATVAWDGPLGLNDLAYVSVNHDLFNPGARGTSGQTLHYLIPYGDWLLGATASRSSYHQSVAGLNQDYVYAGESRNAEVRLSRLLYRDQRRKTTLALRAFRRASFNFIDDTEIEVQRRVVGGWELGLNHREFLGAATLDANLQYRRGTGAFGARPAPEEFFGEGTSRFGLVAADASLNLPFQLAEQKLRYSALWRAQWNRTALTPQDRFAVGGRYTVRGFDGETSLMAERGWLLRNDLGWALGQSGAELYVGIDHGEVGGGSSQFLLGKRLTGGVLGLRGATNALRGLSYDVFIGAPLRKPEGYRTAHVTGGFNLNFSF
jgi:hemolysin activation/secretion protein